MLCLRKKLFFIFRCSKITQNFIIIIFLEIYFFYWCKIHNCNYVNFYIFNSNDMILRILVHI